MDQPATMDHTQWARSMLLAFLATFGARSHIWPARGGRGGR